MARRIPKRGKGAAALVFVALAPLPARAEGGGSGAPGLVPMDEIVVPIIDGSQLQGKLRFTLVLRANDAAGAAAIGREAVRLRSVAVAAGLEFASLRVSPWKPVDAVRLARSLDQALHAVMPEVAQALIVRVSAAPQ